MKYANKKMFTEKSITDYLLKLAAIAFFLMATTYLMFFINTHFLHISELSSVDVSSIDKNRKHKCSYGDRAICDDDSKNGIETRASKSIDTEPFSSETVLGIIATLVLFASMLVYIFKKIVREDLLREVSKKALDEIHDERIASKIEGRILLSYILTKFSKLNVKSTGIINMDYLDIAIACDDLAIDLYKDIHGNYYKDLFIKARNNQGNNLALKYKNVTKDMIHQYPNYERDRKKALKIKNDLLDFLDQEDYAKHAYDIKDIHRNSFRDTCVKIEETF